MNKKTYNEELTARLFVKGFVAQLSERGVQEIRSHDEITREGFAKVVRVLDKKINEKQNKSAFKKSKYYNLISLRNELAPSLTGAFDNFEHYLRSLQNSYTECPNPQYDRIAINVTPYIARAFLKTYDKDKRNLIDVATAAYISAFK